METPSISLCSSRNEPVPAAQRQGYYVAPPASEGGYAILGKPRGRVQTQHMGGRGKDKWHGNDQLWWTRAKPGDKLDLAVPVAKSSTYEVSAVLTKAKDYAIVQLYLDGKKAGGPIEQVEAPWKTKD